jgi:hypothetical protein
MPEPFHFNLRFEELLIDNREVARLMNYRDGKFPDHIEELVSETLDHVRSLATIEGGFVIYENISINKSKGNITIDNLDFHPGKIISGQIKNSEAIAVFLCTAGRKISDLSSQLFSEKDFLKGYVYDTIGSVVVEAAMDKIQGKLSDLVLERQMKITNRFSPGYCGWDVAEQQKLFKLMPSHFCNVALSESSLMNPIKSVSGIIGIGSGVKTNPYACRACTVEHCIYRDRK